MSTVPKEGLFEGLDMDWVAVAHDGEVFHGPPEKGGRDVEPGPVDKTGKLEVGAREMSRDEVEDLGDIHDVDLGRHGEVGRHYECELELDGREGGEQTRTVPETCMQL